MKSILKSSTILIVDDDPADADVLRMILEPEGTRLVIADSGEQALRLAATLQPNLILLDVHMPGMDGMAACRSLKSLPETAQIPVLFVTGSAEEIECAFDAGGADYVMKPVSTRELMARACWHLDYARRVAFVEELVHERTRDLERANRLLNRLGHMKSRFLATIHHELRTPLTGIQGVAELLRDKELTAAQQPLLDVLDTSVARMLELVADLQELSTLEGGGQPLHCHDFVLPDLLRYELARSEEFAGSVKLDIDPGLPQLVRGDVGRVGQLVRRLIRGACMLMPDGELVMQVRSETQPGNVVLIRLTVPDHAGQIPAEDGQRIRAALMDHALSLNQLREGLGMSLPVAALTAELLGGGVELQGPPGEPAQLVACFRLDRVGPSVALD